MDSLVALTFLVVALLEICVPLLAGYYFIRKLNGSWKLFIFGATFFILIQVLHFPLVVVTQLPLLDYLYTSFGDGSLSLAVFAVVLGLLAGLFEEIGRFIAFKFFLPNQKVELNKKNALLFGIGWGGVESMFIALMLLLTLVSYMFAAPLTDVQIFEVNKSLGGKLSSEQLDSLNAQNQALMDLTPMDVLPGLFERLMTMILHVAWTLMVYSAVVNKKNSLLVLAILSHASVDAMAVYAGKTYGVLPAEAGIFVFAVIGLMYVKGEWDRK